MLVSSVIYVRTVLSQSQLLFSFVLESFPSLGTSMGQGCGPLKSKKGEVEAEMHSCVLLKKFEFGIWEPLNLKNIP